MQSVHNAGNKNEDNANDSDIVITYGKKTEFIMTNQARAITKQNKAKQINYCKKRYQDPKQGQKGYLFD